MTELLTHSVRYCRTGKEIWHIWTFHFAAHSDPQEPGAHAGGTSSEEQVFFQLPNQRPQEVSRFRLRGLNGVEEEKRIIAREGTTPREENIEETTSHDSESEIVAFTFGETGNWKYVSHQYSLYLFLAFGFSVFGEGSLRASVILCAFVREKSLRHVIQRIRASPNPFPIAVINSRRIWTGAKFTRRCLNLLCTGGLLRMEI